MTRKFKRGSMKLNLGIESMAKLAGQPLSEDIVRRLKPGSLVPVTEYFEGIPDDGVLHRYLFVTDSQVVAFSIDFSGLKSKIRIALKVDSPEVEGLEITEFELENGANTLMETRDIPKGTKVTLSALDYDVSEGKPEIWISYVYRVME